MKAFFFLVLAVMLFSVTDAFAAGKDADPQKSFSSQFQGFYDLTAQRRGMMPMQLIDEAGKPVSLDQYKGRFVVLHFWATWCPPCITELPALQSFRNTHEGKNLAVVLVALDYGASADKISQFMKKQKLDMPVLRVDSKDTSWNQFSSFILPSTFIVSPKGQVLYKLLGDNQDWSGPVTAAFFKNLLANHKK